MLYISHSVWVQSSLWAVIEQYYLWSYCSDIVCSDCTVDNSNNNNIVIVIVIIIVIREEEEDNREEDKDRENREENSLLSNVKEVRKEEDINYVSSDSCWYNSIDNKLIDEL